MSDEIVLEHTKLGKPTLYGRAYDPSLLDPIARALSRTSFGLGAEIPALPFHGGDIWNTYELSWLGPRGKPEVAILQFEFPCSSPYLIESKSLKLYFNSFAQTIFLSSDALLDVIKTDLSACAQAPVSLHLYSLDQYLVRTVLRFPGVCLDKQDIEIRQYDMPAASMLSIKKNEHGIVSYYSDLLKSNCPVTGQPDWGSVLIHMEGSHLIDEASLLRYLVAYRQVTEFHEHCVERIFLDLMRAIRPEVLHVEARYVRRGGLDIHPYRSTSASYHPDMHIRLTRQ